MIKKVFTLLVMCFLFIGVALYTAKVNLVAAEFFNTAEEKAKGNLYVLLDGQYVYFDDMNLGGSFRIRLSDDHKKLIIQQFAGKEWVNKKFNKEDVEVY